MTTGKLIQDKIFAPFVPVSLRTIIKKAAAAIPANRYQSALEMRRALERLSYPGYWTADENGNLVGFKAKDQYYFKAEQISATVWNFTAKGKNNISLRETKISDFCRKRVSKDEKIKIERAFIHYVTES